MLTSVMPPTTTATPSTPPGTIMPGREAALATKARTRTEAKKEVEAAVDSAPDTTTVTDDYNCHGLDTAAERVRFALENIISTRGENYEFATFEELVKEIGTFLRAKCCAEQNHKHCSLVTCLRVMTGLGFIERKGETVRIVHA